jgi:leucyl-tRNA synthetase
MDPDNSEMLVGEKKESYWSSVDLYVGGAEHATRHLIYARFWHKFLHDIGVVSTSEPFTKLQHVGLINAADGRKMSKRWGNVVNPDDVVSTLGADTLRVYEMFMGPFDQAVSWSEDGIVGPRRFLEGVWKLKDKINENTSESESDEFVVHTTIKKVTEDIEHMNFNTAISELMVFKNHLQQNTQSLNKETYEVLLKLLHPFAPHITEELWHEVGNDNMYLYNEVWPTHNEEKLMVSTITLAIQINGKVRDEITCEKGTTEGVLKEKVLDMEGVKKWIEGKEIKKFIYVENKLISIVV